MGILERVYLILNQKQQRYDMEKKMMFLIGRGEFSAHLHCRRHHHQQGILSIPIPRGDEPLPRLHRVCHESPSNMACTHILVSLSVIKVVGVQCVAKIREQGEIMMIIITTYTSSTF